jgi:pyruvate formate lyase activating enzyme
VVIFLKWQRNSAGVDPAVTPGIIFDIQKYAIDDGPGIRTTVFLKGCPLRCLWCHNPEGMKMSPEIGWHEKYCTKCFKCMEVCPNSAIVLREDRLVTEESLCELCGRCVKECPANAREMIGKIVTVDEVFAEVKEDRAFYQESNGGITCSGGEPLVQAEFVSVLFRKCKEEGIHTALDTSGYGDWEAFERILPFTDLVIFDLKNMDATKHVSLTGVDPSRIWNNFERLAQTRVPIWVRCPVVPGYVDDEENFRKMVEYITKFDSVLKLELLSYHRLGEPKYRMLNRKYQLSGLEPPSTELMEQLKTVVKLVVNTGTKRLTIL